MWEKTESLRPCHPWLLSLLEPYPLHTSECREIILYYRQRVELMDIPLRGCFFFWIWTKDKEVWFLSRSNELARSQKTRNNSYCPWYAGSITQKLLGGGGTSDINRISVSGWVWPWERENDKMWELKFSSPFFWSYQKHLLSNCPQTGPWSTVQINRTDKSLQLEMNSSVGARGKRQMAQQITN